MNPTSWARKADSQSSTTITFVLVLVLAAVLTAVTFALSGSRHGAAADTETAAEADPVAAAPRRSRKRRVAGWLWKRAISRLT
jgi:flagellar basal body-associated protein FliL